MLSHYYTHPPKNFKFNKEDPQCHLVYKMERSIIGWCVGTKTDLSVLVDVGRHACKKYGVTEPNIRIINRRSGPFGWCDLDEIALNASRDGDNMGVFIHELAHWIQFQLTPDTQDHGPEFMKFYIELLDQYKFMPEKYMRMMCKDWGIKVAT